MIDFNKYPLPKRFRHHVNSNVYFPYNENIPEKEAYPPLHKELDWSKYFNNSKHPDVLDIGSAFGRFTLKYSLENPKENIFGIEVRKGPVDWMNSIIQKEELKNVNGTWYSVANGIPFINDSSIKKIFYFFPDPWFKHKHQKRRAFQMPFVEECHRVLKEDASLYLQTDIHDVHQYHQNLLKDSKLFEFYEPEDWNLPTTDKEDHCIRKGFEYWRLVAKPIK